MNWEKRSSGKSLQEPEPNESADRKPVVVYILILFAVAFLLIAISFFAHQRNAKALGELQSSVSAMQEIQANQERVIQLQDKLDATEDTLAAETGENAKLTEELSSARDALDDLDRRLAAQACLYTLMQQYAAKDYEGCSRTIQRMEADGYPALLSTVQTDTGVTPPAERYQELKAAVEAKLAG